ncbi:MAG: McrC family protein [Phascolarctobacterium sp.]|nr:McrC family protein [Phascolarctobacterium sp.]
MKTYTIYEYQSFVCNKSNLPTGYKSIESEKTFQDLKQFILECNGKNGTDALDLMSCSYRKGFGEVITAKNYVGLIAMRYGTVIEILPKVSQSDDFNAKKLLIDMLRTVRDLPFKAFNATKIDYSQVPLFEIFITMFINEVKLLLQQGLKSDYLLHQDNEKFLKGKLLFENHIKQNLVRKDRFFVEYHLYNIDRVENRLLKTTLCFLLKFCKTAKNKRELQILLDSFDEVKLSQNVDVDFTLCSKSRDMKAFEKVLQWCEIFLKGNSFTNSQGKHLATALLFPMEKLFESYVAEKLSKKLSYGIFNVRKQDGKHHLFEKKFALRPDIVVEKKEEDFTVVLDTKWKLLCSDSRINYGIAQSDMYQMYAYGKKYETEKVVLLYPVNEKVTDLGASVNFPSPENDNVNVHVRFLDLSRNDFLDEVVAEFF